jgi:hypothetical protein
MAGWIQALLVAGSALSRLSSAAPTLTGDRLSGRDDGIININSTTHPFTSLGLDQIHPKRDNVPLRILSLGASIMSGTGSTSGNGYVFTFLGLTPAYTILLTSFVGQ